MNPASHTTDPLTTEVFAFPHGAATYVLGVADADDREEISRLRHEICARELGQHSLNQAGARRDAARMGARLGPRALRLAVKDAATNRRMVGILRDAIHARQA